jgi:hypothetical protein
MTLVDARAETFAARPRMQPGRKQLPGVGRPGFRGRRKAANWADLLDAGHIGVQLGIPSCTIFHATYRVQDSRMVMAGEEWSDARSDPSVTSGTRHAAAFRGRADPQSIRSLNRSDATDSDHSLDARVLLRLRSGPWPRTRTTRPSFKFSCSNGSTAPGTWPDSTSSRSNQRS